jgi:hypothetical protein
MNFSLPKLDCSRKGHWLFTELLSSKNYRNENEPLNLYLKYAKITNLHVLKNMFYVNSYLEFKWRDL